MMEHGFEIGKDEKGEDYRKLHLPSAISPIKVGVFPLMAKDGLDEIALDIFEKLKDEGIICYYDGSGSIGRRYARMDEVGTPYGITVDYESKDDNAVTIRERDSTNQARVPIADIVTIIEDILKGRREFE